MDNIIKELNLSKSTNFGAKNGQFNVLDVPKDLAEKFKSVFFEKYNKPWLEAAVKRGDDIVVMSDKFDVDLLKNSKGVLTGFGKEIEFMDALVKKGEYKYLANRGRYVKN